MPPETPGLIQRMTTTYSKSDEFVFKNRDRLLKSLVSNINKDLRETRVYIINKEITIFNIIFSLKLQAVETNYLHGISLKPQPKCVTLGHWTMMNTII